MSLLVPHSQREVPFSIVNMFSEHSRVPSHPGEEIASPLGKDIFEILPLFFTLAYISFLISSGRVSRAELVFAQFFKSVLEINFIILLCYFVLRMYVGTVSKLVILFYWIIKFVN